MEEMPQLNRKMSRFDSQFLFRQNKLYLFLREQPVRGEERAQRMFHNARKRV